MDRDRFVVADGPYPRQAWDGEEEPYWVVFVANEWGDPVGKVYECASRQRAIELGARMAKDRGLPFENEAGAA